MKAKQIVNGGKVRCLKSAVSLFTFKQASLDKHETLMERKRFSATFWNSRDEGEISKIWETAEENWETWPKVILRWDHHFMKYFYMNATPWINHRNCSYFLFCRENLSITVNPYDCFSRINLNAFSANHIKWLNTLKQFFGNLRANFLSVFDHFVGLAFKGLTCSFWAFWGMIFLNIIVKLRTNL